MRTGERDVLAIIPARGGSKGVPRKNVRVVAGKPLVAWSIETARDAECVTRVVVSTDDREIAEVSKKYGAEVVWRPAIISGDSASSEDALLDTLEQLEAAENYVPDLVVFLQCTSPLTEPQDIEATVKSLLDEGADTALTVSDFHYFLWKRDDTGDLVGINHDKRIRELRQQRAPQYLETGSVYVMRTRGFREHKHRFFGKTAVYAMKSERCLEIDSEADCRMAEIAIRNRVRDEAVGRLPSPVSALVLDFDGVMTDNRVWVSQDGTEAVACHRGDGMGISQLRAFGVPVFVISTETNPVVAARCRKLDIECSQGVSNKLEQLKQLIEHKGISRDHLVYVGNDSNDLSCLEYAGCGVIVADAHESVWAASEIVLSHPGGHGAVQEICNMITRRGIT